MKFIMALKIVSIPEPASQKKSAAASDFTKQ